jgi:aerobic carbon-monoxide dehydrogenase medium subunit
MTFQLHRPTSVSEATSLAEKFGPSARFLAGGTDLIIQVHRKRCAPDHVIDLSGLTDLVGIREDGNRFVLGSLTTHKEIERCLYFRGPPMALVEASRIVGGHQVRNIGTVGGNIANASPAADLVPPLLVLDAEIVLRGQNGERRLPLDQFLLGPGKIARATDELIAEIHFSKLPLRSATSFIKAGRRKAMEISVVCVAARMMLDESRRCRGVRIALGAVGATSLRVPKAERMLEGQEPDKEALREAGRLAVQASSPITDVRASDCYRQLLIETLVPRALRLCVDRIERLQ